MLIRLANRDDVTAIMSIVRSAQQALKELGIDQWQNGYPTAEVICDDISRGVGYVACAEDGADLAIGSRYCNGISVVNWPIGRVIMSYYASTYVRTVLGMKIFDCTAGFKCYTKRVLQKIDLDNIQMNGYGFQIEMKYTTYKLGFKIKEVPIIFINRTEGTSKMSSGIFGEAFWGVIKMRFRTIKPRK